MFNSSDLWVSLGSLSNSPRLRTITDTNCYTQMQYMLLEPPTGGTWTGTSQFSLSDLSQALQGKRDEMMQISNCNQTLLSDIALTPNTTVTYLPDTVIDVERVRYIPAALAPSTPPPSPVTLYRDDTIASEFYESPLYQLEAGTPQSFSLSSEPPLSWKVDIAPNQPGTYEAVVLQSGEPFAPPTPTLIGIPDDFSWALQYGALAELLGRESEATDRERADYCMKRYQDGLKVLLATPWVMLGKVNGVAVSVDSIVAADRYMPEWDSSPSTFGPCIVAGGIDFCAAPVGSGIGLTVLANAPVPSNDDDFVQASRSNWDTILDIAQSMACFKMGGAEWKSSLELEKSAIESCAAENARLQSMGAFSDILVQRGQVQERDMQRYNTPKRK